MQTKLLNTGVYLLLIDEEAEIKENTWYENNGVLFLSDEKYDGGNNPNNSNPIITNYNNSVIAYYPLTKEDKKLDLPELPNPFEKVDIEKLAEDRYGKYEASIDIPNKYLREGFIDGYKAAQSKQFSLEDVKKAIRIARMGYGYDGDIDIEAHLDGGGIDNYNNEFKLKTEEEIIQSLSTQQLSKQFSLEDMYRVAIEVANRVSRPEYGEIININEIVDTYIQSLSIQQLPKEFILGKGDTIVEQIKNGYYE